MKKVTLMRDHYDAGKKYEAGGAYQFDDDVADFIKKEQGIADSIQAEAKKELSAKIDIILPPKRKEAE